MRRSLVDSLSPIQQDQSVEFGVLQVAGLVESEDDCVAVNGELLENGEHLGSFVAVEARCGLVEDDE